MFYLLHVNIKYSYYRYFLSNILFEKVITITPNDLKIKNNQEYQAMDVGDTKYVFNLWLEYYEF